MSMLAYILAGVLFYKDFYDDNYKPIRSKTKALSVHCLGFCFAGMILSTILNSPVKKTKSDYTEHDLLLPE